jgi:hypothetical protein
MRESRLYGSVRGALSNERPYRVGCFCCAASVRSWQCARSANHQWRKNPPGNLSIDPVADERLMRVTARVGAS